jgi:hypothetical protein
MYTYYKNSQLVINFTVKSVETGSLYDPATIVAQIKVYGPEGETLESISYSYGSSGNFTRASTGTYKITHTPTKAGRLVYGITTTTPAGFYLSAIVIKDNTI